MEFFFFGKRYNITLEQILLEIIRASAESIKHEDKKNLKRKDFSKKTQKIILQIQKHRCNDCRKYYELLHFHHKDGNRSNNEISNAEALCPNCHAKKTRRKPKN